MTKKCVEHQRPLPLDTYPVVATIPALASHQWNWGKLFVVTILSVLCLASGAYANPPATAEALAAQPFSATVTINDQKPLRPVPPLFFGQNIEWVCRGDGRDDGDGLWDNQRQQPRRDTLALLRSIKPALIRFPGGSLSNLYRWADAIGPVAQRTPEVLLGSAKVTDKGGKWSVVGRSVVGGRLWRPVYGFDEHMRLCADAGAAGALVTVNATQYGGSPQWSGSAQEAAAWVAYANSRVDGPDVTIGMDYRGTDWHTSRYWAQRRAANGHPAPYHVEYWEIGNEVAGWQGAGLTGLTYAKRVIAYAQAMHAVDPSARIGAVLDLKLSPKWLQPLLETAGSQIDFVIEHYYGRGPQDVGMTFWNNGERTTTIAWPGGKGTIDIDACGSPAGGVWPEMVVKVDGKVVARQAVNRGNDNPLHVPVPVELSTGAHHLSIAYTNDALIPPEDRNLNVRYVTLEVGGRSTVVHWLTPRQIMARLAHRPNDFAADMATIGKAIAKWAPDRVNHIRIFVTEFNAMYTYAATDAAQITDLKSALMVDRILQIALTEPLCEQTNFWDLNSWWYRIIEITPKSAFLSPSGDVYLLFTPLHRGQVLPTHVTAPLFEHPRTPEVSAVSVQDGNQFAVNLVNFDPARAATIKLIVPGHRLRAATGRVLLGPSPNSRNTPDAPYTVHVRDVTVSLSDGIAVVTIPPHSAATLKLED